MMLHHDEDVIVANVTFFIMNITSFIYLQLLFPTSFVISESIVTAQKEKCPGTDLYRKIPKNKPLQI